jgi:hypothetical protein
MGNPGKIRHLTLQEREVTRTHAGIIIQKESKEITRQTNVGETQEESSRRSRRTVVLPTATAASHHLRPTLKIKARRVLPQNTTIKTDERQTGQRRIQTQKTLETQRRRTRPTPRAENQIRTDPRITRSQRPQTKITQPFPTSHRIKRSQPTQTQIISRTGTTRSTPHPIQDTRAQEQYARLQDELEKKRED